MKLFSTTLARSVSALTWGLLGWILPVTAQSTGVIEGRIINLASGDALARAQVRIQGTSLETLSNEAGEYRFANVAPGTANVTASYSGFEPATRSTEVVAGRTVMLDYSMRLVDSGAGETIHLEKFTVTEQALTAEALAINEQRVADNIKNVVAFEEFGNMGEGNPGEFLKYVPGVSITFGPAIATEIAIRGMPANGTLVLEEGNEIASSTGDRSFELTGAATGNIERIEITKSPTPDMPANAIGGSMNIIGKSGFSSRRPQLTYSAFYTVNTLRDNPNTDTLTFRRRITNTSQASARPIQPGLDLTYKLPVNQSFALTVSASASKRYYDMDYDTTTWNHTKLVAVSYVKNNTIQLYDKKLLSLAADWKVSKSDTLRAKVQYSSEDSFTTQNPFTMNFSTGVTGDADAIRTNGATGVVTPGAANFDFYRTTVNSSITYAHKGDVWNFDASASHSRSGRERRDMEDGFFNTITQSNTAVAMQATGISRIHDGLLPRIVATKGGAVINPYDAGAVPVTGATSTTLDVDTNLTAFRLNAGRSLNTRFPLELKFGGSYLENAIDSKTETRAYTLAVPASAGGNLARNLGLVNEAYSANTTYHFYDDGSAAPVFRNSASRLHDLYRRNPEWFTLNEAANYTTRVNGSKELTETIVAAYLRLDGRFIDNRLRITTGVRYEHTGDDGAGPLNDIVATYQRDANGNIIRNAANMPVRIVGSALTLAQLQYKERGSHAKRSYEGYYPSLNASYNITPNLITRFSYARTISRPPVSIIAPGITVAAPTFESGNPTPNSTVTVGNPGLRPWDSNSFDLTLEYYQRKGTTLTAAVFRKNIRDFYALTTSEATPELLAEYGLPSEFINSDIRTYSNFGAANITGFEWSIRHQLTFLPSWSRGLSLFVNGTHLRISGPNQDDFEGFSRQNINWGVSFVRPRFQAKVNVAMAEEVRINRVAVSANVLPDMFRYVAPQTLVDLSFEYQFSKRISLYASVRNALQSDKHTLLMGDFTPEFARISVSQRAGSLVTLGVKGVF
ncbi:MAG: TonB-dependent receptor [Opitutaceae bacterium]|nr:TonB-dependent receptor [Opitutaceae bacterium]